MPEHVHLLFWPVDEEYEVRLIRTALKVPVARQALRFLKRRSPSFLEQLKDVASDLPLPERAACSCGAPLPVLSSVS